MGVAFEVALGCGDVDRRVVIPCGEYIAEVLVGSREGWMGVEIEEDSSDNGADEETGCLIDVKEVVLNTALWAELVARVAEPGEVVSITSGSFMMDCKND